MGVKRSTKIIAIFVLVAFCFTFGLPLQQVTALAATVASVETQEASIPYEEPEISTKLGAFTDDLITHINSLNECLNNNDVSQFRSQFKITQKALKDICEDISKELSENEVVLDKLKASTAKSRHEAFKAQVETRLNSFMKLFEEVEKIVSAEKLDAASVELLKAKLGHIENQIASEQPVQPLGKSLPHSNASMKPEEPIIGNDSSFSYAGKGGSEKYEVLPYTAVEGDLAETPETTLSEEAKKLADTFDTPVKVYEYVRNNMDFEPYYGSRKGAIGTFNQLRGNDYDQASLLVGMLRYKGIPARYVKGTIELPIEQVMGWTGTQDPEAAVKVLGSLGNPTVSIVSGGKVVAVRTEHVWVEAYVPYKSYNRLGVGKGSKIWIPLDPSFKQYTMVEGLDIKEITGVSEEQIKEAFSLDAYKSKDGDVVKTVDFSKMNTFFDGATEKLDKYLKDNKDKETDLKDIIAGKKIEPENLGVLQLSLPYKVLTTLAKTNTINNTDSEKIGFSISGNELFDLSFGGADQFNVEFKAVELYGKRVTLLWVPATAEDKNIIDSYGGLYKTPTYMIQLKPQLKVDGKVVAEGSAVGFANRQQFTISMGHVGRPAELVTNPVTAGGIYSISFDFGKIDAEELEVIQERIAKIKNTATEATIYTDEVMGEILNSVGKAYFAQLDGINSAIASSMNVSAVRQVSEAMTGYQPTVKYMFGVPVEVSGGSFYIDVDHDVVGVTSLDNNRENEIAYMLNSGVVGSSMEHVIHEQIFKVPSVSSIKIITEANLRGIPVYSIAKDDIGKINELNVSSSVKTDIRNAVNSGKIVIVPKEEIQYYSWYGTGYIVMDPETGAAGYMISGGIAGGSIGETVVVTLIGLASLIMGIIDVVSIAIAMVSITNPWLLLLYFGLLALSTYAVYDTINNIIMYWETGDYKYAKALALDLFINLATFGLFKLIDKFAPAVKNLFNGLFKQMDEVIEFQAKYGDDITEAIVRMNGEEALKHVDELLDGLKGTGLADDLIENVAKRGGKEALEELAEFQAKHGNEIIEAIVKKNGEGALKYADELLDGLKGTGLADDLIENVAKNGGVQALEEVVGFQAKHGDEITEAILKMDGESVLKQADQLLDDLKGLGVSDEVIEKFAKRGGVKGLDEATGKISKLSPNQVNSLNLSNSSNIKSILGSDYSTHLTDVKAFSQSAGVTGGHNKANFYNYLNNNGIQINQVSVTPHSSVSGVEVIKYQIPAKDAAGNIIKDSSGNVVWKNTVFEKTVYDPSIISDSQMLKWGEEAMKEGLDNLKLTFQSGSNTIVEGIFNGLKMRGYWNPVTGAIENFHPIL
jgi:uncharacterized protein YeaC (DUF1315 family)